MTSIHQFKDSILAQRLLDKTHQLNNSPQNTGQKPLHIMEVCGSHTLSIYKYGIDKLLPSYISLLSGPGCPVCVTDTSYIDLAVHLARDHNIIIATFGDMLRVPGTQISLSTTRAHGADIRVVYTPLDCISLAKLYPDKEIVFLGIGFETTAPAIALTLKEAIAQSLNNLSMLFSLKTMPYAMESLIFDETLCIDGFICPGHVAAVIGSEPFEYLAQKYHIPMVIAGFECVDLIGAIYKLMLMINSKDYSCQNLYKRVVESKGNTNALTLLDEIFEIVDSSWRGLGIISKTGLSLKPEFNAFNALLKFNLTLPDVKVTPGCICGSILKGIKKPIECPHYKTKCTPESPIGACMVSSEGTCMNFYKYNN
ncbi:hydrogenase formation protein HypD [Cellulosilyticum sp. I15G10I2]|uniref:hydrogenase formation protein HypD n=1 Tax=Cellulosilyticum sp. I15G10I2 TaxID=1892843 RepID=UPI00085BB972|nr:hydrogenase formation protein HypD [Cellulosilyticum sp. I15G10I2]